MKFVNYDSSYFDNCLKLFDDNCPDFFALNEREDYVAFLHNKSSSYFVGITDSIVVSAFGIIFEPSLLAGRISWILVSPRYKSQGLGTQMVNLAKHIALERKVFTIDIAASHLSAPFFEQFGALRLKETENGWGESMHRVDMQLRLSLKDTS